ncbi:hypothetical protein ACQ4PT_069944 [Festuca glaucescens]
MTHQDKEFIRILHLGKIPPRRVLQIYSAMKLGYRGVGFDGRDVSNLKYTDKTGNMNKDIEECIKRFTHLQAKVPGFLYDFEIDDTNAVCSIFWTDAMCRMNYELYGEYVSFDTTFQTNVYNMPFAPIIGVNNHGSTVLFGVGLLKDEQRADTFEWLFRTFVGAMGGKAPKYIITDQDRAMMKAIGDLNMLAETIHRFCLWHIIKKLLEKIASIAARKEGLSDDLRHVIKNSFTVEEFEEGWISVLERYDVSSNKHLLDLWEIRTHWVPAYFMDCFFPFSSSKTRSESTNSMWKDYVDHTDTIQRFLDSYEIIQEKCLSALERKKQRTSEKTPPLWGSYGIEAEEMKIYTRDIFIKFQKELRDNTSFSISREIRDDMETTYELTKIGNITKPDFEKLEFAATIDDTRKMFSCNCKKMSRDGIQCCHVLRVMVHLGLIHSMPDNFVKPRWRRCNPHQPSNYIFRLPDRNQSNAAGPVRYVIELTHFAMLCSKACSTDKPYKVLMECMDELEKKVNAAFDGDAGCETDHENDTMIGSDTTC